jgi:type IV secretion system protein VirB9
MRMTVFALLASVSAPALAAGLPPADAPDTHIRQVAYSATKRTDLIGVVGQPTTITFPKGESVYRVIQSEAPDPTGEVEAAWRGPSAEDVKNSPIGSNLPLWPVRPGVSMMTIITMTGDGSQKTYAFRLLARPAEAGAADAPGVVFNLIFGGTPPPEQAAAAQRAWVARKQAQEAQATKDLIVRTRLDAFNASTCHYTAKGKRTTSIEPRCPMDDGQWTVMRFPGLSRKPAVYIVSGEDDERLARQHGDGDFVVIEEIAQHFRLRLGDDVLDIINNAYNPAGEPADTGTTAPNVERDVIQARTP